MTRQLVIVVTDHRVFQNRITFKHLSLEKHKFCPEEKQGERGYPGTSKENKRIKSSPLKSFPVLSSLFLDVESGPRFFEEV